MPISATRRAFIGTTPLIALAGCLGYKFQRTEVDNRQEQRLTELNAEVSDLESQVEDLNSQIDTLEDDNSNLESELSSAETDLENTRITHVVSIYSAANEAREFGNGAWSNGIDTWNDGNYASATGYFGRAYGEYGSSFNLFEQAEEQLNEYSLDGGGLLDEAISRLEGLREAAFDMENASYFAAINETSSASDYQDRAQEHLDNVSDYEVADVSEFETQLG